MDGDSEDDESDWEHAQDGQAPVGTVHGVPGYQGETHHLQLFQRVVSLIVSPF